MVSLKLLEWISKAKEKGYSNEHLRELLLKHGYPSRPVDEAFAVIEQRENIENESPGTLDEKSSPDILDSHEYQETFSDTDTSYEKDEALTESKAQSFSEDKSPSIYHGSEKADETPLFENYPSYKEAPAAHERKSSRRIQLHEKLKDKGKLFIAFFYAMLVSFIILLYIGIGLLVHFRLYYAIIAPLILLGIMVYDIMEGRIIKMLLIMFIFCPLGIPLYSFFPFMQVVSMSSNILMYMVIGVSSAILGSLMAFMFYKTEEDPSRFNIIEIFFSSIIAITFAFNNVAIQILRFLSKIIVQLRASGVADNIVTMFKTEVYNNHIAFVIAFILFSVPFVWFYIQRKPLQWKKLLFYLIPAGIYLILSVILIFLVRLILVMPINQ